MTIPTLPRVNDAPQGALEAALRRAIDQHAATRAARPGSASDPAGSQSWHVGWFNEAGHPETLRGDLYAIAPVHVLGAPHVRLGVVAREVARLGAEVLVHVFEGLIVVPKTEDEMRRWVEYRAAGGQVHEHPHARPAVIALAFTAAGVVNVSRPLTDPEHCTLAPDVFTMAGPPQHPFCAAVANAARVGEAIAHAVADEC